MDKSTIFFYSHKKESYKIDKWRHIFSQWTIKPFIGKKAVYDINKNIPTQYVHGAIFKCREAYMMAHKALLFAKGEYEEINMKIFNKIIKSESPRTIKALGRKVQGFDGKIWNKFRYKIVTNGNYLQFTQNEQFKKILTSTKNNIIVEASRYDKIWGIGLTEKQAIKLGYKIWNKNGLNLLGKSLMEVRSMLI